MLTARLNFARALAKAYTAQRGASGAIVLARVEQGLLEESVLRGWLDGALDRADDRALFGLGAR